MRPAGLEPAASRVGVWHSIQLSYGRIYSRDRSGFGQSGPCRFLIVSFLLACIIRQSPGVGNSKTRPGGLLREFHSSEDLSELPPLRDPAYRGAVAGQGYHCGRMRSWRNRLPCLLLSGWIYARHLIGRRLCGNPHRWSWRIWRIARSSADVILLSDIQFSKLSPACPPVVLV